MSWVAVAAVGAAVVKQYNTNKTAKKRDKATLQSMQRQNELQRKASARTMADLNKLEQSTPDDENATRQSQVRTQLRKAQAMALAGINPTGGGDAVTDLADQAGTSAVGYGDFINRELAGIDAPGLQRQGEAFDRADTNSGLARLRRDSGQESNLLRLRMAGIRDSPALGMLSTGLSAYSGTGGFTSGNTGPTMTGATVAGSGGQTPQGFYSNTAGQQALPGMVNTAYSNPYKFGSVFKI
jgi:hypothetical protein